MGAGAATVVEACVVGAGDSVTAVGDEHAARIHIETSFRTSTFYAHRHRDLPP